VSIFPRSDSRPNALQARTKFFSFQLPVFQRRKHRLAFRKIYRISLNAEFKMPFTIIGRCKNFIGLIAPLNLRREILKD